MLYMFSVGQVKSGTAWLSDTQKKRQRVRKIIH